MSTEPNLILAVDLGTQHVGTALAYGTTGVSLPAKTYPRAKQQAERAIVQLVNSRKITTVVVGNPCNELGQETEFSQQARNFCRRLAQRVDADVVLHDEHLTTEEARERLNSVSPRDKVRDKGLLDAVSASIILESYLESSTTNND